jgi:hypothetical protein
MNSSLLVGIFIGTVVSLGYDIYRNQCTIQRLFLRLMIFIALLCWALFFPSKAEAWCDNCKPIPNHLIDGVLDIYRNEGEASERLILEIKEITDKYAFDGDDAFMVSIGAGMSALPSGGDPRIIAVAVVLANSATYFCKTVMCHWKTTYMVNELEYHLYYYKQITEELLHNRLMCPDCHKIYFWTHYMGNSRLYFNHYPPCSFESEGCSCEEDN